MADNLIRWKRGDYIKLSKAVNKFNKQVNELQSKGYNYLPEVKNYQSLKEDIYTRKELNRLINSMKKFNIETAKKVEVAGEEMTAWEYKELKLARNRARRYLEGRLEIQELENPYAKFGLETKEIETTKKTIQSLDKLEKASDKFQLNRIMERINKLGSYDVDMKKAKIYRENYMKLLDNMNNYENIDILKKKLNSIKNPKEFYNYISSNTTLSDLWEIEDSKHETNPSGQSYGGFTTNQDAFDTALKELDLLDDELHDLSSEIVSIL